MKVNYNHKPTKNFQKKKYYTKDLKKPFGSQVSSNQNSFSKAKSSKKLSSWLDGTFSINPQTWEVEHIPKK
jgi:hypothetical protein